MAIYRKGQASMDAQGYITGYNTSWRDQLTLIRSGATIVFATSPATYATISEVISDTSIRATATGGAVIDRTDYVILLHDSITVDGLAQDVAETLRYYQGQETMYEEFVEFLKTFDWKKLEALDESTKQNAAKAETAATNAKASEVAAKTSQTEAKKSQDAAKVSQDSASASQIAAAASQAAAKTSETNSKASETAAKTSQTAAKTSETNAKTSENAARASQTAAAASATAAKTSETNSKASETNAKASETAANTSKTQAAQSAQSADASKTAAAGSATAAAGSATTAKNEADRAQRLADSFETSKLMQKANNLSDVANVDTSRNNLKAAGTQVANTFTQKQTFSNTIEVASSAGNPLLIKSANPCIRFEEVGAPAGSANAYMFVMDGGGIRMQENDTGSGSTVFNYSSVTKGLSLPPTGFVEGGQFRTTGNYSQDSVLIKTTADNTGFVSYMRGGKVVWRAGAATTKAYAIYRYNDDGTYHSTPFVIGAGDTGVAVNDNLSVTKDLTVTGGGLIKNGRIELGQGVVGAAYIDFHYYAGKYDHDARIIVDGVQSDAATKGNMRFYGGSFTFNGGAITQNGTMTVNNRLDVMGGPCVVTQDGAAIFAKNKVVGNAVYVVGVENNGNSVWYLGRGSNGSKNTAFHNYQTGNRVSLEEGKIKLDGSLVETTHSLTVMGTTVTAQGGSGTNNSHFWLRNTSGRSRGVIYAADANILSVRPDNGATGATGSGMSINGATGEVTAAKFTNTSDERAKFWIKPVTGALDKLCALKGVTYSMHTTIQNTVRNAGLIAQDVQKVLPEAVSVRETGNTLDKECRQVENPLSLDYNALSALYVEAFKEMKAEIDNLKAEIDQLKNNNV